ncbi:hypothetical protein D3C87_345760 [compost metagenome]
MKKTLLIFSLCASMFASFTATAQETPYTLNLYEGVVFYGMYGDLTTELVPPGMIRLSNSSYSKMLTQEQLDSFGNTLNMKVTLNPLCDNYDRIGNVNMVLAPKALTAYTYNDPTIKRFEIGRFITPFMDKNDASVQEVPYEYELNHLTNIFHDVAITTEYNIWIELEVYGYQGGPGQGGAAVEIPGCEDRKDVYMGNLEFTSENSNNIIYGDDNFILPLSYKYQLRNYVLEGVDDDGNPTEGTQEIDKTIKTITFTLEEDLPNATFHLITSNHGANQGGEEYERRWHYIYIDDVQELEYKPGGKSCEPYRVYNTQGNGIYGASPRSLSTWLSFNNWCPGDVIPNRVIELGPLAAGEHKFKIEVPDAEFVGDQGYFPLSLYLQSVTTTLGTENFKTTAFSIYPNPVTDIATIDTKGMEIKAVTVINTLGQTVLTGTNDKVDMSQLQKGIYMVKVQFDNNQTATKKIVKN